MPLSRQAGERPRTLPEVFDQLTKGPPVVIPNGYTPLEEVDERISRTPELAPIRDIHAILPKLAAQPRDSEVADPFVALYTLAVYLANRTQAEFEADDRWHWMLVRHRAEAGNLLYPLAEAIGFEAKRLAARCGLRDPAPAVVDRMLAVISRLIGWDTVAKPTNGFPESKAHSEARRELEEYLSREAGPAETSLLLLTEEIHTHETRRRQWEEGSKFRRPRLTDKNPADRVIDEAVMGMHRKGTVARKKIVEALKDCFPNLTVEVVDKIIDRHRKQKSYREKKGKPSRRRYAA